MIKKTKTKKKVILGAIQNAQKSLKSQRKIFTEPMTAKFNCDNDKDNDRF